MMMPGLIRAGMMKIIKMMMMIIGTMLEWLKKIYRATQQIKMMIILISSRV